MDHTVFISDSADRLNIICQEKLISGCLFRRRYWSSVNTGHCCRQEDHLLSFNWNGKSAVWTLQQDAWRNCLPWPKRWPSTVQQNHCDVSFRFNRIHEDYHDCKLGWSKWDCTMCICNPVTYGNFLPQHLRGDTLGCAKNTWRLLSRMLGEITYMQGQFCCLQLDNYLVLIVMNLLLSSYCTSRMCHHKTLLPYFQFTDVSTPCSWLYRMPSQDVISFQAKLSKHNQTYIKHIINT